jgi:hypothetical protein
MPTTIAATVIAAYKYKILQQILNHMVSHMASGLLSGGSGLTYRCQDVNPAYDDSGKYCSNGQSDPVWFLTSTYKHSVDRHCSIPAGKPFYFISLIKHSSSNYEK